ncbi:hypothetical protein WG899_00660 [Paucibacter sp. AS339]|uniref:hypothetical protein n=1 Tax=Paucibacter hankyongi TaxID=3133434 RepID=UPI0030A523F6
MNSPDGNKVWSGRERRQGKDRRQSDKELPKALERRKGLEPRHPEVQELELSAEEWARLNEQFRAFG